jgi:ribosomal protein L11 methyltransferase
MIQDNNTIRLDLTISDQEQNDILICELSGIDYYAFEEGQTILSAYIKEKDFDEGKIKSVISRYSITYSWTVIPETNWNAKWESEFTPVVVDEFVAVRADFHKAIRNVKHEIIITPKMSFGTGHHATTYLMLQMMRGIDFKGKAVLDFGTGTGVLAILAEKLGGTITAIDNDDWSITNAKENIEVNNCEHINVYKADVPPKGWKYDIVLANINLNIILGNIENMVNAINSNGLIAVSGILTNDVYKVAEAFKLLEFKLSQKNEKEGWACLTFISE